MSTFRRNATHSRKLDSGASLQQPLEPGPAADPSLYNAPLPAGNQLLFRKTLEDYIRRFRPSDFVENSLVRQLASIEWRIRRNASAGAGPGSPLDIPASSLRYSSSLVSARSAVFRALCRLARDPRCPPPTQKRNQVSHMDPESEPGTNSSSSPAKPENPPSIPPNSPLKLD